MSVPVLSPVTLGRLLLALDGTLLSLVEAPQGLDRPVASVALFDHDDLLLGVGRAARGADVVLLVGVGTEQITGWLATLGSRPPVAILMKSPSDTVVRRAAGAGVAIVAVDPHARWERIYNLVGRVLEQARAGPPESMTSGVAGDLFALAQAVADRTGGLVSIEDADSHVLAYSTSDEQADELRRLSILGREGPAEMLDWLRQWGVFGALRSSTDVVSVARRDDLGLRPRLAVGLRTPSSPAYLGTLWLQQTDRDLAPDAAEVMTGAAAVAARIIAQTTSTPSIHGEQVQRLLGFRGDGVDVPYLTRALGISEGPAVVVGLGPLDPPNARAPGENHLPAVTLHASAFRPQSVTAIVGGRIYVLFPQTTCTPATMQWARATVTAAQERFGMPIRAVIAEGSTSDAGRLREEVDRVLDAARIDGTHIDRVTTVEQSRTVVLLGRIVALLEAAPELVDPRVSELADYDLAHGTGLVPSVRAYLDAFGDVRAAAAELHVHPNTLRYRVRRAQELTGIDLADPASRLVVSLALRV